MMNRSVMQRQMFKAGGAAGFPDLNKDGDITQADILMGRGVKLMERGGSPTGQMATFVNPQSGERVTLDMANEADVQMMDQLVSAGFVMDSPAMSQSPRFAEAEEAPPVGMQMGGDPMMAAMAQPAPVDQGVASMMAPEPAMDMASMGVGEVDQGTVEQMLAEVAPAIGDPEQAESAEEMMNMVRGDEASVEQRRMELASIVGEEDAMQTPESVLALVQPVVQMSLVDEGIGGLAEQEMQEPVEGAMAGGIMSMMGG
jgi:hypothetical protein